MMPPSAPQEFDIIAGEISFSSPLYSGGGNIQNYEVWYILVTHTYMIVQVPLNIQVHIREQGFDVWYWLCSVPVKALTAVPDIPKNILSGVGGSVYLRVCARNLAGRGACSTQLLVMLNGANL